MICSVYAEPNSDIHTTLEVLERLTRSTADPILISGDFNARHTAWGDNVISQRGSLVLDFIARAGMAIENYMNAVGSISRSIGTGTWWIGRYGLKQWVLATTTIFPFAWCQTLVPHLKIGDWTLIGPTGNRSYPHRASATPPAIIPTDVNFQWHRHLSGAGYWDRTRPKGPRTS